MKQCTRCKEKKEEEDFYWKNKRIRKTICKTCCLEYGKKHYLENKKTYIKQSVKRNKAIKDRNVKTLLHFLSDKECKDCGENDPIVLEFDHRDPKEKTTLVSRLYSYSWKRIKEEIDKCDIRCANCHKRKTAVQLGWRKLKYL